MKSELKQIFKNLPEEIVNHIISYKKNEKCIICNKINNNRFYKKFLNVDLCCYRCYLSYFYGYVYYRSIIFFHILFSPVLFLDNIFFKTYYGIVFAGYFFLQIEQYFYKKV